MSRRGKDRCDDYGGGKMKKKKNNSGSKKDGNDKFKKNNNRRGKKRDKFDYFRNRFPHIKNEEVLKKAFNPKERENSISEVVEYDFEKVRHTYCFPVGKTNLLKNFKESYEKFRSIKEKKCRFVEKKGDLFTSWDSLAHCVSEDLKMGKGIATQFVKVFGQKGDLIKQNKKLGEIGILQEPESKRTGFFMITKKRFFQIPSYNNLFITLKELAKICNEFQIKRLSMPKIACGLDRLKWSVVKNIIVEAFYDNDITVTIYHYIS